jgi:Amt family ammonium transporter
VLAYSLVLTFLITWGLCKIMRFRVDQEAEVDGIDEAEHAEGSYDLGTTPGGRSAAAGAQSGPSRLTNGGAP